MSFLDDHDTATFSLGTSATSKQALLISSSTNSAVVLHRMMQKATEAKYVKETQREQVSDSRKKPYDGRENKIRNLSHGVNT